MGHMRDGDKEGPWLQRTPSVLRIELKKVGLRWGWGWGRQGGVSPLDPESLSQDGALGTASQDTTGGSPWVVWARVQQSETIGESWPGPRTRLDRPRGLPEKSIIVLVHCQLWEGQTKVSGQRSQRSAPASIHFINSENIQTQKLSYV